MNTEERLMEEATDCIKYLLGQNRYLDAIKFVKLAANAPLIQAKRFVDGVKSNNMDEYNSLYPPMKFTKYQEFCKELVEATKSIPGSIHTFVRVAQTEATLQLTKMEAADKQQIIFEQRETIERLQTQTRGMEAQKAEETGNKDKIDSLRAAICHLVDANYALLHTIDDIRSVNG